MSWLDSARISFADVCLFSPGFCFAHRLPRNYPPHACVLTSVGLPCTIRMVLRLMHLENFGIANKYLLALRPEACQDDHRALIIFMRSGSMFQLGCALVSGDMRWPLLSLALPGRR
jgi:hypothetical protein